MASIDDILNIKVKEFYDSASADADLQIKPSDLSGAFCEQAGLFAFYATRRSEADHQFERLKSLQDWLEAQVDHSIRQKAIERGEKITEPQIERSVRRDKRVMKMAQLVNDARRQRDLCKGVVDAFNHRRDMLVQAGADDRQERKGELRMKEVSAGDQMRHLMGKAAS